MTDKITATCTRHTPPVPLHVSDANDDTSRVVCPECKTDFGSWAEVKTAMKAKLGEQFKDTPWISVK